MKLEVVGIKDAKSREWNPPATQQTCDAAIRAFGVMCLDDKAQSLPALYPADFDLWHFGSFDTVTGAFEVFPSPLHLANGADFARKEVAR